jgi:hypothetical protein
MFGDDQYWNVILRELPQHRLDGPHARAYAFKPHLCPAIVRGTGNWHHFAALEFHDKRQIRSEDEGRCSENDGA